NRTASTDDGIVANRGSTAHGYRRIIAEGESSATDVKGSQCVCAAGDHLLASARHVSAQAKRARTGDVPAKDMRAGNVVERDTVAIVVVRDVACALQVADHVGVAIHVERTAQRNGEVRTVDDDV